MGGNAFNTHNPPLPTPRMPPGIYKAVLEQTTSTLQKYYSHVGSPIEGPGKSTFGDVDILVFGAHDPSFSAGTRDKKALAGKLAQVLNAIAFITEPGNPTINLAIIQPVPEGRDGEGEKYAQVDLHICQTFQEYQWTLFHSAHGDLWNILGTTIRPFGLTVNGQGMYLRIPEIELLDRKKSMILLTSDSGQILELLGLDKERWWREFESRNEMFEFAAGCRMFWIKEMEDGQAEGDIVGEVAAVGGQEGGESGKKKLKHNDRQRMSKRPIFKEWIEHFIPKCREEGRFRDSQVTREQIRDEAFAKFGIKGEYEERLGEWQLARHEDELWRVVIKGSIPIEDVDPAFRAAAIRELKSIIMEGEEFEGQIPEAAMKNEQGFHDLEAVRGFVLDNWKQAGDIGWIKMRRRAAEGMQTKAEKKKKKKEEGSEMPSLS